MKTIIVNTFSVVLLTSLLSACGGSGSDDKDDDKSSSLAFSGNDEPAEITDANAEEIGIASGEAVLQANSSSLIPSAVSTSEQVDLSSVHSAVLESSQTLNTLPAAINIDLSDQVCTGGGSASSNVPSSSGQYVQKITYKKCAISSGPSGFTIDGQVKVTYEDINDLNSGYSLVYKNVTISGISSETVTLNYTFSCTSLSDTSSCTTSSIFSGSDGQTHLVSNYQISGSTSSGLNGSATFSHYTHGSVSITASNLTYGNCNSQPDGGSIAFSSTNGSSGSINFHSDCTVSGSWGSTSTSASF